MATPYFLSGGTYLYFDNGVEVPYPIETLRYQSIAMSEDGRVKVYDHSLAGTYKRRWLIRAQMDNAAAANHRYSDFLSFVQTTVVFAKTKFTYYDKDGSSYTVRIIEDPRIKTVGSGLWRVEIMLEEDYT